MKKTVQRQITVDKTLIEKLEPYMAENGIRLSALVRILLIKYMKEKGLMSNVE